MSKELIGSHSVHETLMRQTQIDAAHIEELERKVASRDAEIIRLIEQNARRLIGLCKCGIERDQLREQVTLLRETVLSAKAMIAHPDNIAILDKALAATEQKP